MAVHVAHRIGAIIVSIVTLGLVFKLMQTDSSMLKKMAILIVSILVIQVTLGVINVTYGVPLYNATAHNLVGATLVVSMVALRTLIWLQKSEEANNV
jgi:cytochrome c oxidase assembly protein subunit 15